MEIVVFKVKSRILPIFTFGHSDLNILSYKSPFDVNSILLDFWLEDLSATKFQKKRSSCEIDMIFLRWYMNFANKYILWRNKSKVLLKASKLSSKSLFQQFSSSKLKVKVWRFYARLFLFFFRKIVIERFKCKLST